MINLSSIADYKFSKNENEHLYNYVPDDMYMFNTLKKKKNLTNMCRYMKNI